MRAILIRLGFILFSTAVTLFGVEIFLQVFDPLDHAYYPEFGIFWQHTAPDATGYTIQPHNAQHRRWYYTVNTDGNRAVPSSDPTGQRVTFIGDSVTFGWGVSDNETWVDYLSADLHLNAVNLGRPGYNAGNIRALLDTIPPDTCLVYLSFSNDDGQPIQAMPDQAVQAFFLPRLLFLINAVEMNKPPISPTFEADMRAIMQHDKLMMFAFDDTYGQALHTAYGIPLIPMYTETASKRDPHASVGSNRQIANAIAPLVREYVRGC